MERRRQRKQSERREKTKTGVREETPESQACLVAVFPDLPKLQFVRPSQNNRKDEN